jgi:hypothetical protein
MRAPHARGAPRAPIAPPAPRSGAQAAQRAGRKAAARGAGAPHVHARARFPALARRPAPLARFSERAPRTSTGSEPYDCTDSGFFSPNSHSFSVCASPSPPFLPSPYAATVPYARGSSSCPSPPSGPRATTSCPASW